MDNFKNTGSYHAVIDSFEKFKKENPSKIDQLALLSEICQKEGLCADPLLDYLNSEFNKLLKKHEYETSFDFPERHQDIAPEDVPYFATHINAYDELTNGTELQETFDYEFGSGTNPWDVGIVRK